MKTDDDKYNLFKGKDSEKDGARMQFVINRNGLEIILFYCGVASRFSPKSNNGLVTS